MGKTWLLIDGDYLAWRAYHTMNGLKQGAIGTGVLYGFLRDAVNLTADQATRDVAFCFDSKKSKRKEIYPGYKKGRKDKEKEFTEEEIEALDDMRKQLRMLRQSVLKSVGYRNVFHEMGYEGDDLLASLAFDLCKKKSNTVVIVTADKDLFQCVRKNVVVYNPHQKLFTGPKEFEKRYGIWPQEWPKVKALAGCKTDDVPGLKGVGELTASGFLSKSGRGVNKKNLPMIEEFIKSSQYRLNLELVTLPFKGTPKPVLTKDEITSRKWKNVALKFGMKSIAHTPPGQRIGFGLGRGS